MDQRMDQMQNIDITYLDLSIKTSWYPAKIDILMNEYNNSNPFRMERKWGKKALDK